MNTSTPLDNYQYPAPKLIMLRGVWVVKVSIPAQMRHLFGNGSGTTRDRRKSTKTKDFKIAKSREHQLAKLIYDEFDERLRLQSENREQLTDTFAMEVIKGLAQSFHHRNIPDLYPTSKYKDLEQLKSACDVYSNMVFNDASENQVSQMVELLSSNLRPETLLKEIKELLPQNSFSLEQKALAGRYKSHMIHYFWQDLLIVAARTQGLPEPSLEPITLKDIPFGIVNDQIVPDVPVVRNAVKQFYDRSMKSIDRPARVLPQRVVTISAVMNDYMEDMCLKQKNVGTQRKLRRWVQQFHAKMGDLKITEIKPKHGYDYIRSILKDDPNRSNKTLKDYIWGVQNFLKYCVENGVIDINPFTGLDLSKYGAAPTETYAFSSEDLETIFSYDWMPQERLYLSLLATTGMRPSEVGNLTWERFNDTEHKGIKFFTLLDAGNEIVQVKNQSSRREVPLHPNLDLPPQSFGRLFDYRKDDQGLSATASGRIINPIIRELLQHPNKSIRSFRRTFKTLLRDLSVSEEVHDAITGHTIPSASRKNYGGMGMRVKFDAICKLDISFLGQPKF